MISKNSCDEDALEVGEEIVILNDFFAEWWVFFAEVCLGVDEGEGDIVVWLGISFDTGWINRFAINIKSKKRNEYTKIQYNDQHHSYHSHWIDY